MDKSGSKIYINEYGTKRYFNSKGYYHRLDGPAIEWLNGDKKWLILSKFLKEKEFNSWILRIKKFIWIQQKCI